MRPVFIPIETASRELLYKVILCSVLAGEGISCYLGSKRAIHTLLRSEKGYLYLDKGYHQGHSDALHSLITSQDGVVVNLDEEGAVDFPDGSTLRNRYPEALFRTAKKVFLWGTAQESSIREAGIQSDTIQVTGHPRFELLKAPYRFLYEQDANRLRQRFGPFILFNTNMGFGNNIRGDGWVRTNYASRFDHLDRIMEFDDQKFESMIEAIRSLRNVTSLPIVLRPHPEENADRYRNCLSEIEDVHVLFEGSAVEWIVACEIMIHPDCTTAIEARMLGKQPVSFLPQNSPEDLVTRLPLQASTVFSTTDAFVDHVEKCLTGEPSQYMASESFLNDWFAFDRSSIKLISEHVLEECSDVGAQGQALRLVTRWKLTKSRMRRMIAPRQSDALITNKLQGFTSDRIEEIVTGIKESGMVPTTISYTALDHDLYRFKTTRSS